MSNQKTSIMNLVEKQEKQNIVKSTFSTLTNNTSNQKTLIVSLVGAPNAGKSTLTNNIIGDKITITSPKAHTTIKITKGIFVKDDTQLVFLDHPGFMRGNWSLDDQADHTCVIIDATHPWQHRIKQYIKLLQDNKCSFSVVVNKGDLIPRTRWVEIINELQEIDYKDVVWFVSALYGKGIDGLLEYLIELAYPMSWLFDVNIKHDQTDEEIVLECVREKVFHLTHKEVPYGVKLDIEKSRFTVKGWECHIVIKVPRIGQKAIVIGRNGSVIKAIGQAARTELCMKFGPGSLFLRCVVSDK